MNEVIPSDTRYIPLTQQKWCYVPTCIQMVMLRNDIPLVPAELIGSEMGLVVPEEEIKYFWNGRTGEKPLSGYGTQAGKAKFGPNSVFKRLNIPLKMKWSLISKFQSCDVFLKYLSKFDENKDVLVCFDWGALFNEEYHGGHVCALDKVYIDKSKVRIIDPDYLAPKWREVEIRKLYDAMKFHGKEKSAGFWELSKND